MGGRGSSSGGGGGLPPANTSQTIRIGGGQVDYMYSPNWDEDDVLGVGPVLYISMIKVEPSARGKGIGTKLLNKVKDIADKNDTPIALAAISMSYGTNKNGGLGQSALESWYKKQGFKMVDEPSSTMIYTPKRRKNNNK